MGEMEQEVSSDSDVRADVVFSAISKVILDERFTFKEIKGICKVLGKGSPKNLLNMVVAQTTSLPPSKVDPV